MQLTCGTKAARLWVVGRCSMQMTCGTMAAGLMADDPASPECARKQVTGTDESIGSGDVTQVVIAAWVGDQSSASSPPQAPLSLSLNSLSAQTSLWTSPEYMVIP